MKILNQLNEDLVRDLSNQKNEPGFILDKRLNALKEFNKLSMPNFRYGLNIKLNYDFDLDNLEINDTQKINLSTNKKIIFSRFEDLKDNEILKEYFMKLINNENKFLALNSAFFSNGILIYVPKNTKLKDSLTLSVLQNSSTLIKHLLIVLDKNSELNFIDDLSSDNKEKSYSGKIVEIFVKENAKLNYINLQNLSLFTYNFNFKKAKLYSNSTLNLYDLNFGSKLTYSDTIVDLDGENSRFEHYGAFVSNEIQQFDLGLSAVHNKPYTYSNMLTKGALNDNSKAIYRGLIKISKDAHNSNGYQKEDTILLSNKAESDSIPKLEIDNNDVRCTHGASISQIDNDKLFYLMSRGLDEKEAKMELINGFFDNILRKINFDNEKIKQLIQDKVK